jgi:hypothetical protein
MDKRHIMRNNVLSILDLFLLTVFTVCGNLLVALVLSPATLQSFDSDNIAWASLVGSYSLYILFSPQFHLLSARKRISFIILTAFSLGIILPISISLANRII